MSSLTTGVTVLNVLGVVALVLATVIVVKAIRAYQQNSDRAMLLLASGLFLLVLAPTLVQGVGSLLVETAMEGAIGISILQQTLRIAGLGAILLSMYVHR
ncbi:DUF7521 family protein [Natronobiforma cellulositropha]|uniref:DUF7521 family protein n=1 Tax=Natronobiforma cellulositropha TaxID=1679076 RepID=UPI0021D5F78E|nr:hypothetical protein [Natronobiforma cellulositropha]